MLYRFLLSLVRISLRIYFRRMVVTGTENIPPRGPLIIVANHPNTLMDPLIIAAITHQRIGFVANAGIFANRWISAVFRYFHVIPVYRKKDVGPGEKPDNRDAFAKCHEYLAKGGTFLIFPEGSSYYELKLREIKTGTARIALSYEVMKSFQGNLKILPITIDYSDSIQFRSMVSVIVNPSMAVSDYQYADQQEEVNVVKELTEEIRMSLARNIPQTSGKEQEIFLIKSHKFYTTYIRPEAGLYTHVRKSLEVRSAMSGVLRKLNDNQPQEYEAIQDKVHAFFRQLKTAGLTTGFFTEAFLRKNSWLVLTGYVLTFVLLAPVYLFGLVTNYLPYRLPSQIFEWLKLEIEYKTSVQLVSGMILFPLFYAGELWLFRNYVNASWGYSILLLTILIVSGYAVMFYWTELQRFARVIRFYFKIGEKDKTSLMKLRDEISMSMKGWGI